MTRRPKLKQPYGRPSPQAERREASEAVVQWTYADIGITCTGCRVPIEIGRDLSRHARDKTERAREELVAEIG